MNNELVLVTGGSGFIGAHCILQLLGAGYRVRTTVRSLQREADVRAMLKAGGAEPGSALSFVAADLMSDAGWPEAVADCPFLIVAGFRLNVTDWAAISGYPQACVPPVPITSPV